MNNRTIRGIAFDLDGTLLDTEKLYLRFWVEAAHRLGYPMKPEHVLMIRGMGAVFAEPLLKEIVCPEFEYYQVRELRRVLMDRYISEHGVEAKPGLVECLTQLKDMNLKIVLATASPEQRAKEYLKSVCAEKFFDAFACGNQVEKGKPAPDIYLLAASLIGEMPQNMMAVEDAPNGILSAQKAGMFPVMIPDLDQPAEDIRKMCYAVLPSLSELPRLIKLIN